MIAIAVPFARGRVRRVLLLAVLMFAALPATSATAAMWTPGPTSVDPHVAGVSVELLDGQVLLAGGGVNSRVSKSGELLPANGTGPFLPAGTMTQERLYVAATRLHNGDVLIAGGDTSWTQATAVPRTAEVWRPSAGSGTFTATGPMHVARQAFTLTTLPNGQALAVGGSPFLRSGAGSATAELYHPATNEWTLTGSMPSGRLGHTATLLPNCKVLIVGDAHRALLYDYATGKFSPTGGEQAATFQRSYQTATLLANGKVLIAGGVTRSNVPVASAGVYNPATGTFTPTDNTMSMPRSQGFAARLADGRVIVGGGFTDSSRTTVTDAVDIYNPETNLWSATQPLPSGSFAESVEAHTLPDGHVSVTSLRSGRQTETYTPDAGTPVSPHAQKCSDLFSIVSTHTGAQGKITLRVAVPYSGGLKGAGTVPAQSGVASSFPYGSVSQSATRSGVVTLTITPGQQARNRLQSKGTLRVDLAVTFTQPRQSPLRRSVTATARRS
jgi:hypothetical protein